MAAPKAPVLDGTGKKSKDLTLDADVFGAEVKPHLVHETVRAEFAAARAGTKSVKSRGLVRGGRAKPWRQKGTGRARAGTIRAVQWRGGGVAFSPRTNFEVKVNRKERRAAFRAALSDHAQAGTIAVLGAGFDEPSSKGASSLIGTWGQDLPLLVVATADEEALIKSFRNLAKVLGDGAGRARGLGARVGALAARQRGRARAGSGEGGCGMSLHPNEVLLAPVVSEKSYSLINDNKYSFRVHPDAHKTQVRQAVEELFDVKVQKVNIVKVQAKPKRRGMFQGSRPGWKKAIVQLAEGETIEIFEGAQV